MAELSGYASGIPAPQYYQRVWEAQQLGEEKPEELAGLSVLVEVARLAKEMGEPVSTADAIAAFHLALNLARFRARPENRPQRDDILDALKSSFIKGPESYAGQTIKRLAATVMVGERVGEVTPAAGRAPLVEEFYSSARKYRLPLVEKEPREINLDLYQNPLHREKSQFLHRLKYLEVTYASFLQGPDFVTGQNLRLITELWQVQWSSLLDGRLIELSPYGSTLREASQVKLQEELAHPELGAGQAAGLLLEAARMGLYEALPDLIGELKNKLNLDNDFRSLVDALFNCFLLFRYREALITTGMGSLLDLAGLAFNRAILLIPPLVNTSIEPGEFPAYTDRFRTLLQLVLISEIGFSPTLLIEAARRGLSEPESQNSLASPFMRGALYGVLLPLKATSELEIVQELENYAWGNRGGNQAGSYLEGLLTLSKGVLLSSQALIKSLNNYLTHLNWEHFVQLLPALRRVFTVYSPREIDLIAERIAALTGRAVAPPVLTLSPGEIARLRELDLTVSVELARWGIKI